MTAYRDDYRQAGVGIFPLWLAPPAALRLLLALALALLPVSLLPYLLGSFGRLYLATALTLGAAVVYASLRLLASGAGRDAWRVYKLSAYPYLGLLFLAMWLDRLL
jgi:protoheme IX farnesyltransferase